LRQIRHNQNKNPITVEVTGFFGADEQDRTAEPLPYQGSALPTELHQRISLKSVFTIAYCKAKR
jgi:hypothetical protein